MAEICANCNDARANGLYHVQIDPDQIIELALCESCEEKFDATDWTVQD